VEISKNLPMEIMIISGDIQKKMSNPWEIPELSMGMRHVSWPKRVSPWINVLDHLDHFFRRNIEIC
jgi:hypothetical protein